MYHTLCDTPLFPIFLSFLMKSNQPYRIVIAGGGSAGWMCAAALSKVLPRHQYDVTLVESADIGTVSVGEATIPNILNFNGLLGIDENAFLKATHGTFKLGIAFEDWGAAGNQYMHPFGQFGVNLAGVPFHHYLLKQWQAGQEVDPAKYCLEWAAAQQGRFCRPVANAKNPLVGIKYAYHFDAVRYADFLRRFAIQHGVTALQNTITQVEC